MWKALLFFFLASTAQAEFDYENAEGFFRVEKTEGGYHFVDPNGEKFFSFGVNDVSAHADYQRGTRQSDYLDNILKLYGSKEGWAQVTFERLKSWGWNTLGTWSDHELFAAPSRRMVYTPIVDCSPGKWTEGRVPDYYTAEFQAHARQKAYETTKGRTQDPYVLGYFIDNEVHWGADARNMKTIVEQYMRLPASSPGKKALIQFLSDRFSFEDFRKKVWWRSPVKNWQELLEYQNFPHRFLIRDKKSVQSFTNDFLLQTARLYFQTCSDAVREFDSNHLLLGSRFLVAPTWPVLVQAASETQDVISFNQYQLNGLVKGAIELLTFGYDALTPKTWPHRHFGLAKKPLLVSEFGVRAITANAPGTWPPFFPWTLSQEQRAKKYVQYIEEEIVKYPFIIGYHIYKYTDQPFRGRDPDGENTNWGLVDINDEPYDQVVNSLNALSQRIRARFLTKSQSQK